MAKGLAPVLFFCVDAFILSFWLIALLFLPLIVCVCGFFFLLSSPDRELLSEVLCFFAVLLYNHGKLVIMSTCLFDLCFV